MLDISGSPDHLTETGVATSTAAPIKVAPIKSIFSIVVLLNKDTRLIKSHASIGTLIKINFAWRQKTIVGRCLIGLSRNFQPMPPRRFPPPWSAEVQPACFVGSVKERAVAEQRL
jgi:hypothetical protein